MRGGSGIRFLLRFIAEYVVWTTGFVTVAFVLVLNVSVEAFRYAGF